MSRLAQLSFLGLAAICVAQLATFAADDAVDRATPADITGNWSGTARGKNYSAPSSGQNNTGQNTNAKGVISTGTASVSVTFTQTNSALTALMTITPHNKSGIQPALSGTLSGIVGNNSFWISGITSNANSAIILVLTGHVAGSNITGIGIGFSDSDREITYKLKPAGSAGVIATGTSIPILPSGSGSGNGSTSSVTGVSTGKQYSLTGTAKSAAYRSTFTGMFSNNGVIDAGQLTIGSDLFTLIGPKYGSSEVIAGTDSTMANQLIISVHGGKAGGKGIGILFSNDTLIEFKFTAKSQSQ